MKRTFILVVVATLLGAELRAQPDPKQLRDRYESILLKNPTRGTAFRRLYDLWKGGDGVDAWISRLEKQQKDAPADPGPPLLLGWVKERTGDSAGALRAFEEAARRSPEDWRPDSARAEVLQKRRRLDAASAACRSALSKSPPPDRIQDLLRRLGKLRVAAADAAGARKAWEELIKRFPDETELREELAELLITSGERDAARAQFVAARQRHQDAYARVRCGIRIAELDAVAGKVEAAGTVLEALLGELAPGSFLRQESQRRLERAFRARGHGAWLVEVYAKWLDGHPDDIDVAGALARLEAARGRIDDAIRSYRQLLERAPGRHDAREALARLLQDAGHIAEAVSEWERLAEATADEPEAWERLGAAWLQRGDVGPDQREAGARRAFERIATNGAGRSPADAARRARLAAEVFARYHLDAAAEAWFQRATELHPEDPSSFEALGRFLFQRGRKDEGAIALRRLCRPPRDTPRNRLRAARLLSRRQYRDDALEILAATPMPSVDDEVAFSLVALRTELLLEARGWARARVDLHRLWRLATSPARSIRVVEMEVACAHGSRQISAVAKRLRARLLESSDDTDPFQWLLLVRLLRADTRAQTALADCDRALTVHPKSFELLEVRAELLRQLHRYEDGVKTMQRMIAVRPRQEASLLEDIADLEIERGNPEGAIAAARRLIALSPESRTGWLLVAELQWETGKRGAAIDTLRAGVRRAHGDLELRAMLGGRLVEAGRMGEAFDELARAISEPGRLPDKLHMAARLVVEARTRAGAVPPGLQRALSDLLTRDVSSVYAAGLAQRLAKDLQAIARALESQGSKTSVLARRRLRQVATDAAIRVETALALLDDAIDRRDVVAALEELSRLLPFEHRGADPVRLRRIWSEAGGWLFGVQPAADALIAPASMREDGSNLVTLDLEHPPSRRLVELANQMGRLDALRARCAAGARDPAWRVFIGAGLRALCGVARKPAATGAIRELARILDGVNNEAPESERAFAVACSLVVSRGCADRPSLRGLVDIVASPQRWRLVAKNQQSGNRRAVIAVRARAAARAGRRESARSLYADLVAGILPGGGRLRGVGLKGGQSARKLYEVVRPYLGRMAEDGFWDLVADALFDLASSDLATAEGSAGGFSEEWDRILGAWEVRAAADPGAGRALSDAIRQARQQRSSDRNVKTIVLLASAKRQERALRDVSRRVLRGGAGLRNLTTGRALWRAGLNEAARRVVIERAPRSTSKAFPRKWSVPWAPDTWASWFTSPEAVRQIVRATASRKNSSLVSWAADLVAVVGTRAERWAPTSRTAYYAAAWPGLRRMGENSHLVNRADNLVARGKLMEAYLLLSRAILQKTEIRMSLVFGGVRAQPGSQRSPARAFLDIAHRVDAVGALRARLRGSAGQAPPRGRVERRLLALLALQDGDIDAATSWIDLVVADWKNAVRFSQDQSRAVLADAANAAPLTRGLALRLLDGYQAPFAPLPIEPIQLARTALAATTPEQALHIISKLLRAKRTGAAVRVLAEAGRGEAIDLYRQLAILEVPPPRAPLLNPRRPGVTLPRPVKTKATPPVPGLWREENLVQTAAARVILGLSPKRLERVVVRIESAASDWERVRGAETVTWIACRIALGRPPSRRQAMERVGSSWPGNAGLLVDMAERSSYATATARIVMDFVERWPAAFRGYGARLVELARRTGVALPLGSKPFLSSLGYQVVDDHDASRWMSRRRTGRLSPLSQDEAAEESAALLTEIVEAARESGDDATAGRAAGLLGRRFGLHQWTHLAIAFTAASDPHAAWAALRDTMGVGDDTPAPRPLAVREWQDHAVAYLDVARRAGALLEASTLPSTTPAAAWCRLLARGHTDRVAFVRDLDRLVAGRLAHRLGDDTGVVSGLLAAAEVAAEVTELKPKATELVSLLAGIPALRRDQARLLDVACKVGAWSDVADLMLRRLGGLDERHAGDAASRFAITRTVQAIVRRAAELGVLDDLASGLERARLDGPFVAGEFARARARLEKKPILPGLAFVAERTGEGMLACTWQMHGAVERQAAGRTLYPPGSAGWTIRVPFVAKAEATVPDADHILVVERVVRGGRWQEFARVNARSPGTTDGLHRATIDADPGSGLRVRARWMDGEQLLARSRSVLVAAAGSDHARDRRGRIVYPGDPRRRLLLNAWAPPGCAGSVRLRNTGFWGSERGRLELPVESPTGSVFVQAVLDSRTGLATENVGQPFPVCASEAISYLTTRDQGRAQWCELQGDPSVAISVRAW